MKNIIFIFTFLWIFSLSCKKESEIIYSGSFTYENEKVSISHTRLVIYTPQIKGDFSVQFSDLNVFSESENAQELLTQANLFASFDLNSKELDRLSTGTYVLNDELDSAFTCDHSYIEFNDNNLSNLTGTISISKNGDTYNFDFDLETSENKVIIGSYSGTMSSFESEIIY